MRYLIWGAVMAALLFPNMAFAQPACGDRTKILTKLAQDYKEVPTALGLTALGAVLEVFTSPDGGTWSIIVTKPDGETCLVSVGKAWEEVPRAATERGEKS